MRGLYWEVWTSRAWGDSRRNSTDFLMIERGGVEVGMNDCACLLMDWWEVSKVQPEVGDRGLFWFWKWFIERGFRRGFRRWFGKWRLSMDTGKWIVTTRNDWGLKRGNNLRVNWCSRLAPTQQLIRDWLKHQQILWQTKRRRGHGLDVLKKWQSEDINGCCMSCTMLLQCRVCSQSRSFGKPVYPNLVVA